MQQPLPHCPVQPDARSGVDGPGHRSQQPTEPLSLALGTTLSLTSADGTRFTVYRAEPRGPRLGAVVVLQEIFGVNDHIRQVTDGFARDGYLALAPALFDRVRPGLELAHDTAASAEGRRWATALGWEGPTADVQVTVDAAAAAGKVGVVGYGWGGSLAFRAAARVRGLACAVGYSWGGSLAFRAAARVRGLACAVGYYGGQIVRMLDEVLHVPVLLHFGEKDSGIPPADVQTLRQARPAVTVHTYPAGHAFNRDVGPSWEPTSAALAQERTLAFLARNLR